MSEIEFIRTALFVPGNRPDRVDKAVNTAADAVLIDLEDAVPYKQKKQARSLVQEKIRQHQDRQVFVRVNALDSEFVHQDLEAVVMESLSGIIFPKIESPAHIRKINRLLLIAEQYNKVPPGCISVIPLIETALAVQNAFQIVAQRTDPERLFTVAFGAADFALDMGFEITVTGEELFYPRARIAVACRAAGVKPPLDTPFMIDLKDREALEADVKKARQIGFQGKLCIQPNQVDVCNRIFSPTKEEIEYARKVIQTFEQAEAGGKAAIQLDGKFIDYPVVENSRRILKMAAKIS
ncbi:MAG: CoA ester lyase [Deltaproteobacteria bacterium]|nr:MAG: CoA ester lyase [Deltaproteobacteria bacterium]